MRCEIFGYGNTIWNYVSSRGCQMKPPAGTTFGPFRFASSTPRRTGTSRRARRCSGHARAGERRPDEASGRRCRGRAWCRGRGRATPRAAASSRCPRTGRTPCRAVRGRCGPAVAPARPTCGAEAASEQERLTGPIEEDGYRWERSVDVNGRSGAWARPLETGRKVRTMLDAARPFKDLGNRIRVEQGFEPVGVSGPGAA